MSINRSRRYFIASAAMAAAGAYWLGKRGLSFAAAKPVKNQPRLGINLTAIQDYSGELPFVDMFKQSRPWVSQRQKAGWGEGPPLNLDSQGWITKLALNCYATAIVTSLESKQFPSGRYTVLYEGEGKLRLFNPELERRVVHRSPGKIVVDLDASTGWGLEIHKTNPDNYIRNIRVLMPGFENASITDIWHPSFIQRWSGIACLRFMDMMLTNNSKQQHWADRPQVQHATYSERGMPVELMVDLANRQMADPWFCMPHMADDDYVRQFASYVKQHLNPALKVWVEYSNEVWNSGFEQSAYARNAGLKMRFSSNEWEAGIDYTAFRALKIFGIWQEVFGGNQRLVRVLASQSAYAAVSERLLAFKGVAGQVDVLAIAPYMQMSIAPQSDDPGVLIEKTVVNWSLDQLFDYLEKKSLPDTAAQIAQAKKIANQYGVRLVAYEAGQHAVGVGGSEHNDKLTALLLAANGDARMGKLYQQYLRVWQQHGDLLCAYNSVSEWSKWGSWSVMRYYNEPPAQAHKYRVLVDWAKSLGQTMQY